MAERNATSEPEQPERQVERQPERQVDRLLDELAQRMERLKQLYEQFFLGLERAAPQAERETVQRAWSQLQQRPPRNTRLRFRFTAMLQKWNTYSTYWDRTLRELEAGTTLRQRARAKQSARRASEEPPPLPKPPPLGEPRVRPPPPPDLPATGLSDGELRALHQKYLAARRQTGEEPVSLERLAAALTRQLRLSAPVQPVRFEVALQNGRAVLRLIK